MTSFPSPLSKNENISLQNISEIVRTKQQELNNVHDMHIQQLEKVPNQISTYLSSFTSLSPSLSLYLIFQRELMKEINYLQMLQENLIS
jgi:hypothetical protein